MACFHKLPCDVGQFGTVIQWFKQNRERYLYTAENTVFSDSVSTVDKTDLEQTEWKGMVPIETRAV